MLTLCPQTCEGNSKTEEMKGFINWQRWSMIGLGRERGGGGGGGLSSALFNSVYNWIQPRQGEGLVELKNSLLLLNWACESLITQSHVKEESAAKFSKHSGHLCLQKNSKPYFFLNDQFRHENIKK